VVAAAQAAATLAAEIAAAEADAARAAEIASAARAAAEATAEREAAAAAAAKAAVGSSGGGGKGGGRGSVGGRARAFDMFDFITDKGQPIQSLTLNAEGQFTESLPVGAPFVFKFKTLSDLFRDGEGLKGEMDAFVQSYTAASNKRRTTKGRAARGIAQQHHPVLYDAVRKALPASLGLLYEVNSESNWWQLKSFSFHASV
jgi:multidrug efflux pump subunit AcrA (membrane-fusion protein)